MDSVGPEEEPPAATPLTLKEALTILTQLLPYAPAIDNIPDTAQPNALTAIKDFEAIVKPTRLQYANDILTILKKINLKYASRTNFTAGRLNLTGKSMLDNAYKYESNNYGDLQLLISKMRFTPALTVQYKTSAVTTIDNTPYWISCLNAFYNGTTITITDGKDPSIDILVLAVIDPLEKNRIASEFSKLEVRNNYKDASITNLKLYEDSAPAPAAAAAAAAGGAVTGGGSSSKKTRHRRRRRRRYTQRW
jgi:hypothetical protein